MSSQFSSIYKILELKEGRSPPPYNDIEDSYFIELLFETHHHTPFLSSNRIIVGKVMVSKKRKPTIKNDEKRGTHSFYKTSSNLVK